MAWELTTVADDEVVAFDGTDVAHWIGLAPDTDHDLDGLRARTLPRPPGERLATIATVNDVHFGEVECGVLDGWADPVVRVEAGEPPYPETMNGAAVAEIAAADPDLVVVKGDLTSHGLDHEYQAFLDCYGPFGERLLHVRGNHESEPRSTHGINPVQTTEVPGAAVVLLDTSVDGRAGGTLSAAQLDELDACAAAADRPVLVFGHHHVWNPAGERDPGFYGIEPAASEALLALVARRPAIVGYFAGHTHRNRVQRFALTGDVPFVEVACVKDFPGAWAEYRVFDGGILQVFRRIAAPEALAWSERTRVMFAGHYHDYAFGGIDDRCFALPLALILLVGCGGTVADVARDDDGRATEAGPVRADRLRVGDCFDDQDDQSPDDFPVVPCDERHDNEVFLRFQVPGDDYPGEDVLVDLATTRCRGEAFTDYVGAPIEGSGWEVFQVLPSAETWSGDADRDVLCVLFPADVTARRGTARSAGALAPPPR